LPLAESEATKDGKPSPAVLVFKTLKIVAPRGAEVDETRKLKMLPEVKPVAETEAMLLVWRVLLRIAKEAVAEEPKPVSKR